MRRSALLAMSVMMCGVAIPAVGDWIPPDGHKMHFPQMPDVNGWDVYAEEPMLLADDWRCSETGPVDDIHFWGSWKDDVVGSVDNIMVRIYDDDRTGEYSKPGEMLWERTFQAGDYSVLHWGTGDQGWYNPSSGNVIEHDHDDIYQINIENIDQQVGAFVQEVDTIYWLAIRVNVSGCHFGWKSADVDAYPAPYTGNHFEDDAVWSNCPPVEWRELTDPLTSQSLDLAFVITPEPTSLLLLSLGGLLAIKRRR